MADPSPPGFWETIRSAFTGGSEPRTEFRTAGPFGLTQGPSVRLRPDEKSMMEGLAQEGYAPSQLVPMEVGESGSQVGRYTLPEEAGGAIEEGAIRMAPIREGIGVGARYNARSRSDGAALAEEVAHDLTLSDTTRSQQIARQVAKREGANADSLESLMTTSFDEDYSERPQEKIAKSLVPALQAIGGVRDSSEASSLHLRLAGQLMKEHGGAPSDQQAFFDRIRSRPTGVAPAQ